MRKWLSSSTLLNKIFCASCMVFSDLKLNESPFAKGHINNFKYVYKAVEDHENSKSHQQAVSAALQCSMSKDISTLINRNMAFKHLKEVEQRRLVIKRLIDIIFFYWTSRATIQR
jgi:hypothetical protein